MIIELITNNKPLTCYKSKRTGSGFSESFHVKLQFVLLWKFSGEIARQYL